METETDETKRELSGEKAQRIIDAMRSAVAARGIAGATFEHVSGKAGVSRGLLHYYFGTKERLLIEVVRRDSEIRIARLDEPLAAAQTTDDVLEILVSSLLDTIRNEPEIFALLYEVFGAARRNPEIQRELADLFARTRGHLAGDLEQKHDEGVIELRHGADATAATLFAIADGIALQALSDPEAPHDAMLAAGREAARHLLEP